MPSDTYELGSTLEDDAHWRRIVERAEARILAHTGNQREAMIAFDVHGWERFQRDFPEWFTLVREER